jgi:hypothetical protein
LPWVKVQAVFLKYIVVQFALVPEVHSLFSSAKPPEQVGLSGSVVSKVHWVPPYFIAVQAAVDADPAEQLECPSHFAASAGV